MVVGLLTFVHTAVRYTCTEPCTSKTNGLVQTYIHIIQITCRDWVLAKLLGCG